MGFTVNPKPKLKALVIASSNLRHVYLKTRVGGLKGLGIRFRFKGVIIWDLA